MRIGSILVLSDLTTPQNIAVRRACHLAGVHQATLKLMHVPAGSRKLADIAAEARGVDLIVLANRHERSTAAFFRGRPVLGLLRRLDTPVLVVRRSQRAPYSKVLVAVDFTPRSLAMARIAAALDPLAQLELFHAVDTGDEARLRSTETDEQSVRSFRAKRRRRAQKDMSAFQESFGAARRDRTRTALGRGDAGWQTVLRQQRTGADLVVVGKKRRSAWEDFLCGSVAHRVLSWGSSDVLIVPDACVGVQQPLAPDRIGLPGAWAAMALAAGRGAP